MKFSLQPLEPTRSDWNRVSKPRGWCDQYSVGHSEGRGKGSQPPTDDWKSGFVITQEFSGRSHGAGAIHLASIATSLGIHSQTCKPTHRKAGF